MSRSMPPRFHVPDLDVGHPAPLPEEEARHLTQVLRLGVGCLVHAFDGVGREFVVRITGGPSGDLVAVPVARTTPAAEPPVRITVAQVVLKGDKMSGVVRDAVMLGAAAIQPLVARRSDVRLGSAGVSSRVDRWRRVAVASTKQCGRAVVTDVRTTLSVASWLAEERAGLDVMLIEPGAVGVSRRLQDCVRGATPTTMTLLIGPEGGWERQEIHAAQARGFEIATLGSRTLRAEVVPVVALAVLLSRWGDLG